MEPCIFLSICTNLHAFLFKKPPSKGRPALKTDLDICMINDCIHATANAAAYQTVMRLIALKRDFPVHCGYSEQDY